MKQPTIIHGNIPWQTGLYKRQNNTKVLANILLQLILAICAATIAQAQPTLGSCYGTLTASERGYFIKSPPESVCQFDPEDERKILQKCEEGQLCEVQGTLDDCATSGECVRISNVSSALPTMIRSQFRGSWLMAEQAEQDCQPNVFLDQQVDITAQSVIDLEESCKIESADDKGETVVLHLRCDRSGERTQTLTYSVVNGRPIIVSAMGADATEGTTTYEKCSAQPPNAATSPDAHLSTSIADRSGSCAEGSLWDHNGSQMVLTANGSARNLYYENPSAAMKSVGVTKGTLLFNGKRLGDRYEGVARRFSLGCGAREYNVTGHVYDEHRVVLSGVVPGINPTTCRSTHPYRDRLVFRFLGCR